MTPSLDEGAPDALNQFNSFIGGDVGFWIRQSLRYRPEVKSALAPITAVSVLIDLLEGMGFHEGGGSLASWKGREWDEVAQVALDLAKELEESVPEPMRLAYRLEMERLAREHKRSEEDQEPEEFDPEDFMRRVFELMRAAVD